ncbi:hypothetical protein GCM10022384_07420 [Streptomyces marokkonensis]|uniref:Uncharacterized protein n=1 Tax=Streptomyces marokkonensis TaxID=324855 RepID=A0ABP7P157_9ACTN
MTEKHEMSWEPDFSESVDENLWMVRELTGVTTVRCSCGLVQDVTNSNVQRTVEERQNLNLA